MLEEAATRFWGDGLAGERRTRLRPQRLRSRNFVDLFLIFSLQKVQRSGRAQQRWRPSLWRQVRRAFLPDEQCIDMEFPSENACAGPFA